MQKSHAIKSEDCPPDPSAGDAEPCSVFFCQSELVMQRDEDQRYGELQSTADISVGVAFRGDVVHLLVTGNVRQEGIIENIAIHEADLRDEKEEQRLENVARPREVKKDAEECAGIAERGEELFLGRRGVCDRAQYRRANKTKS